MENSYRFFENRDCQYYPCHPDTERMNCLFCYCPLYNMEQCPGTPQYIMIDGQNVKDCKNCSFPHKPENYERIVECLKR